MRRVTRAVRRAALRSFSLCLALAAPAAAQEKSLLSFEVDTSSLWAVSPSSSFVAIDTTVAAPGSSEYGLFTSYAHRPLWLRAPSPDPEGRRITIVRTRFDLEAFAAYTAFDWLRLHMAIGGASLNGQGPDAATSQRSSDLNTFRLRDPRFGTEFVLKRPSRTVHMGFKLRQELSVPIGGDLVGHQSIVYSPTAVGWEQRGRWFGAVQAGFRFRQVVTLGDARLGTQGVAHFGLGYRFYEHWLAAQAELWLWPVFVSQRHKTLDGTERDGELVPAEWLLSVSPLPRSAPFSAKIGAGSALPLSRRAEDRDLARGAEYFAGPGTPRLRFLVQLGYRVD